MKWLCVGSGSIATAHAGALRALDQDLHMVVGRRLEATAAFARAEGFANHKTDLEEALRDEFLEAAVITSPSEMHVAHARACLARGLPTLVEIPVALSVTDAQALDAYASNCGLPLMVAHTRRFRPTMLRMREIITSGQLTLHAVHHRYGFIRRENVNWVGHHRSWTDNLLWHHGGHAMDALMWVSDVPSADVTARLGSPHHHLEIPMDISVSLRTPTGIVGSVVLSYNTHQPLDDSLFIGEQDTIYANYATGTLVGKDGLIFDAGMTEVVPAEVILAQDREFVNAAEAGRDPRPSIADVMPSLCALQQVQDQCDRDRGA